MLKFKYLFLILGVVALFPQRTIAQDFYDIDSIQEIRITFSQSNWDYLMDSLANIGYDRLMAQNVTINGVSFDSAGVRYKGNSSYNPNNNKNPLNIGLDYLKNQNYNGYETFKLSSGFKDPSFAREVIGYEIARKYMPAPKANYVKVYINNNFYGLFTNVESVNKDFLEDHFETDQNVHFKCDGIFGAPPISGCPPGGGSGLAYMGSDTACYGNSYELKSDYGWGELVSAINTLNNVPANVEQAIYVDRALWMLAFNNVLVNFDSYTGSRHNYYVYQDNDARFNTILWDLNEVFGVFAQSGSGPPMSIANMKVLDPLHNMNSAMHPLIQKLLANSKHKKSYMAHLRTILEENFANNWYSTRLPQLKAIVDATVQADANKIYTYQQFLDNYSTDMMGIPGLTSFISARTTYLNGNVEVVKVAPTIAVPTQQPSTVAVNDTVWITSSITNATGIKLRYRFQNYDVFLEKDMLDDGSQMDGAAGDGVYGGFLIVPAMGAQYYIFAENADAAKFSPVRAEYEFYNITPAASLAMGDLVINEFMASNSTTIADPNGQFDDWVELYNNTANPISLSGLYLSDNYSNPTKWAFPDTTIAANGYLIIWTDDDATQPGIHTTFKLSATGEELSLWDAAGNLLDSISFGAQGTDITTGRFPNGTGLFITMTPTPGAINVNNSSVETLNSLTKNWRVFPNPLHQQQLNLELEMNQNAELRCSIFNSIGQQVWDEQYNVQIGKNTLTIPQQNWPAGIYTITIQDGEGVQSQRVVKN